MSDTEDRLRAALAARAELVHPEDLTPLAPLAPVVPLRPRWQSPWVLVATAAVVLLVLGLVVQGVGGRERSDRIAPRPDQTDVELEIPADIGRDWKPGDLDGPERLDLDGDGTEEVVQFLAEKTEKFDGRFRLQTTISSTGEEAYGIASLGTTIGINSLEPIDADGDGDQELVLYFEDLQAVGGGGYPLVYDLRDGLLVQAVPDDPTLLVRGQVAVEGSATEYYEMVRVHDYWIEDGVLRSSRSVDSYATGNMTMLTPRTYVIDTWSWTLDDAGALRHGETECLMQGLDSRRECGADPTDTIAYFPPERASYVPVGETVDALEEEQGYGFTARVDDGPEPTLVVEGYGRVIEQPLDVREPLLGSVQPTSIFFDGASLVVTSASDPSVFQVLVQDDERMVKMEAVGEIGLVNDDEQRTWLTENGAVVSAIRQGDAWSLWSWMMVSRTEIAALPLGTVCIDDVDDPTSIRAC
jgi:hypothetical protein